MAHTGKVPLASNFAAPADGSDKFEWLGVWKVAQSLQDLSEVRGLGEAAHGVKVLKGLKKVLRSWKVP